MLAGAARPLILIALILAGMGMRSAGAEVLEYDSSGGLLPDDVATPWTLDVDGASSFFDFDPTETVLIVKDRAAGDQITFVRDQLDLRDDSEWCLLFRMGPELSQDGALASTVQVRFDVLDGSQRRVLRIVLDQGSDRVRIVNQNAVEIAGVDVPAQWVQRDRFYFVRNHPPADGDPGAITLVVVDDAEPRSLVVPHGDLPLVSSQSALVRVGSQLTTGEGDTRVRYVGLATGLDALPGCDPHGVPDALAVRSLLRADLDGDLVPDGCEPDEFDGAVHVRASAAAGGDGRSWATAVRSLADACRVALDVRAISPGTPLDVRVTEGDYRPDEGLHAEFGDRRATFPTIAGARLEGGYPDVADPGPLRDPLVFESILQGDLGPAGGAYSVVEHRWPEGSAPSIVDGFTIRGGRASQTSGIDERRRGGGLFAGSWFEGTTLAPLIVEGCTFEDNEAHNAGGAIFASTPSIRIDRCRFIANVATGDGEGRGLGGAMQLQGGGVVTSSSFIGNEGRNGGAVAIRQNFGTYTITNCSFRDNVARTNAAGGGGALWISGTNNEVWLQNAALEGNASGVNDHAAYVDDDSVDVLRVRFCAFDPELDPFDAAAGPAIDDDGSSLTDGPPGLPGGADGSLALSIDSPAIDAGNRDVDLDHATPGIQTFVGTDRDVAGLERLFDVPDVPNSGVGSPAIDIGSHELRTSTTWVGGPQGSWFDDANWSTGATPDETTTVTLAGPDGSGSVVIQLDELGRTASARQLIVESGTVELNLARSDLVLAESEPGLPSLLITSTDGSDAALVIGAGGEFGTRQILAYDVVVGDTPLPGRRSLILEGDDLRVEMRDLTVAAAGAADMIVRSGASVVTHEDLVLAWSPSSEAIVQVLGPDTAWQTGPSGSPGGDLLIGREGHAKLYVLDGAALDSRTVGSLALAERFGAEATVDVRGDGSRWLETPASDRFLLVGPGGPATLSLGPGALLVAREVRVYAGSELGGTGTIFSTVSGAGVLRPSMPGATEFGTLTVEGRLELTPFAGAGPDVAADLRVTIGDVTGALVVDRVLVEGDDCGGDEGVALLGGALRITPVPGFEVPTSLPVEDILLLDATCYEADARFDVLVAPTLSGPDGPVVFSLDYPEPGSSDPVYLQLGAPSGDFEGFDGVVDGAFTGEPVVVAVGDLDAGDGAGTDEVLVALEDGILILVDPDAEDGVVLSSIPVATTGIRDVAVGDLDGDGLDDVAVLIVEPGSRRAEVLVNDGTANLTSWTPVTVPLDGDVVDPRSIAIVDAIGNDDGLPRRDLVVSDPAIVGAAIVRNDGDGEVAFFFPPFILPLPAPPNLTDPTPDTVERDPVALVTIGDGAGPGDADVAIPLQPNGTGTPVVGPSVTLGPETVGLVVADLDGDGRGDLATVDASQRSLRLATRSSAGDATYSAGVVLELDDEAADWTPRALAAGDVDGDGDVELLVLVRDEDTGTPGLRVLRNDTPDDAPDTLVVTLLPTIPLLGDPLLLDAGALDDADPAEDVLIVDVAGSGLAGPPQTEFDLLTVLPPPPPCPADLTADGLVGFEDLLRVLADWGEAAQPSDLDGDGVTGFGDLLILLAAWGDCPA